MVRSWLVATGAVLLLASSASAGAWSKDCVFAGGASLIGVLGTGTNANKQIGAGQLGCYRFVAGDTGNSGLIYVTAESAVITFDPQLDAAVTVATTALVNIHMCPPGGPLDTANPERSCVDIGGANGNAQLDGVEGASATQNAAIRVGPGVYYVDVTGACLGGDTCQVTFKGEGALN